MTKCLHEQSPPSVAHLLLYVRLLSFGGGAIFSHRLVKEGLGMTATFQAIPGMGHSGTRKLYVKLTVYCTLIHAFCTALFSTTVGRLAVLSFSWYGDCCGDAVFL